MEQEISWWKIEEKRGWRITRKALKAERKIRKRKIDCWKWTEHRRCGMWISKEGQEKESIGSSWSEI